jgi:hypothetical protein
MKWFLMIGIIFQWSISNAQSEAMDYTDPTISNVKPITFQNQENNSFRQLIKNQNATDVIVEGVKIDKRAVKYYYEGELQNISSTKAKKIILIYLHSYEFSNGNPDVSEACKLKFQNEKDLGPYNYLRKFNERVEVAVEFEGCDFKIYLFSWKEIDDMINQN